jgi:hypothetical protein
LALEENGKLSLYRYTYGTKWVMPVAAIEEPKKEEEKKVEVAEDDVDLFGSDEDDEEAEREREARIAKAVAE